MMKTTTLKRNIADFESIETLLPEPAQLILIITTVALAPSAAAAGGVLAAILIGLAGAAADGLVTALGGTAALVYIGTAMVSARRSTSLLDLGAGIVAISATIAIPGYAVGTLFTHAAWGVLRGASSRAAPGRYFAAAWAAFHGTAALLLSFST